MCTYGVPGVYAGAKCLHFFYACLLCGQTGWQYSLDLDCAFVMQAVLTSQKDVTVVAL
jgi:hypothetical protein